MMFVARMAYRAYHGTSEWMDSVSEVVMTLGCTTPSCKKKGKKILHREMVLDSITRCGLFTSLYSRFNESLNSLRKSSHLRLDADSRRCTLRHVLFVLNQTGGYVCSDFLALDGFVRESLDDWALSRHGADGKLQELPKIPGGSSSLKTLLRSGTVRT